MLVISTMTPNDYQLLVYVDRPYVRLLPSKRTDRPADGGDALAWGARAKRARTDADPSGSVLALVTDDDMGSRLLAEVDALASATAAGSAAAVGDDGINDEDDEDDDEDSVAATPFALACIYGRADIVRGAWSHQHPSILCADG